MWQLNMSSILNFWCLRDVLNIDWLWQDEAIHVIGGIQQNCVRLSSFAGFGANAHWFANRTAFLLNFLRSVSTICPSTFNFSHLCSNGRPGGETTARGGLLGTFGSSCPRWNFLCTGWTDRPNGIERGLTTPCHLQICWIFLRSLESTKCVLMFSLSRLDCFANALVSWGPWSRLGPEGRIQLMRLPMREFSLLLPILWGMFHVALWAGTCKLVSLVGQQFLKFSPFSAVTVQDEAECEFGWQAKNCGICLQN